MYFLPPYSPELNPDEYLNNDVKSNAVGRVKARSKREMTDNILYYLRSTQKQPEIVKAYFKARSVRYAAQNIVIYFMLGVIKARLNTRRPILGLQLNPVSTKPGESQFTSL